MTWSITEVARMSKVTSRTLRHYDQIGLLTPAHVSSNGYRYYEQEQLLRLQRVLLLRELGLGLTAIAAVLGGEQDQVEALRVHEQDLRSEGARLARLADTVSRTSTQIRGGEQMSADEMFEGFTARQARYEEKLVTEHGEGVREHFRSAKTTTKDWGKAEYADAEHRQVELDDRMITVMRSGAAPDSAAAQDVIADHHAEISRFWTPNRESYTGLGRTYVQDPQFKTRYDAKAPGLAKFLRDAITGYAAQHLT
ncbi:TipAS antibiotic-recognition domain-containing protein (plasmid) [Rhodococcus antarcticus]|uniref:TipAS antibiotic-recognition domain-containing protein n=1 Tax=Rhodococcus antarcticus TaxID=2987751 RepID=A0ABY6P5I3_9NOCA|nr:TipAS antibiotic-recognition domain-containing protein [Rhodococcus antarcticus]UZJ26935.1 TipAS antibiotic-recognition domain-containing protein [Rhodococcus antarcticus]